MDLICTKLLVAFLFAVLRFFFGILPVKLHRILMKWEGVEDSTHFMNPKRHKQVNCCLALCQSFGGGVLFATAFLHMMPEVYKSVESLKELGDLQTDYPLSQMTVSIGFFLVYFVEEFSHWFLTKVPDEVVTCPLKKNNNNLGNRTISPLVKNKVTPVKEVQKPSAYIIENVEKNDTTSLSSEVVKENEKNEELNAGDNEEVVNEVEEEMEKDAKTKQQIMRYVLVVLALSFHAVFEGLAIGLQQSIATIWYLFTAVMIHSATILFYISLELLLARTSIKVIVIHILVLSLTSPTGVLMGLLITMNANMNTQAKSTAVVLLEGLSAGTILYITFFEVLNREKERRTFRLRRALCILGGFAFMAVLQCAETHLE